MENYTAEAGTTEKQWQLCAPRAAEGKSTKVIVKL